MKVDPIIQEIEAVKDRLDEEAGGDLKRFLDQMEAWQTEHPSAGPVVNSPEELEARLRRREAAEPPPPPPNRTSFTIRSLPKCIASGRNFTMSGKTRPSS